MLMLSGRSIEGWAIRYNSRSVPLTLPSGRLVYEQFTTGAFERSVAEINSGAAAISANVEHAKGALTLLGASGKNLQLEARPEGVFVRLALLDETLSNDLWAKIAAGLVRGFSIEFGKYPGEEPAYSNVGADYLRTFARAQLLGLAITDGPVYSDSTITAALEQPAAMARSLSAAETTSLAGEVDAYERVAAAGRLEREYYEAWMYGVR